MHKWLIQNYSFSFRIQGADFLQERLKNCLKQENDLNYSCEIQK